MSAAATNNTIRARVPLVACPAVSEARPSGQGLTYADRGPSPRPSPGVPGEGIGLHRCRTPGVPGEGASSHRRGFTLVELLVTIAIIGMLTSLLLGGLFAAQESAKVSRTRSLVARLNAQLMERWSELQTRRLPDPSGADPPYGSGNSLNELGYDAAQQSLILQRRQLFMRRQLMRMEFPDNYRDLQLTTVYSTDVAPYNSPYPVTMVTPATPNPNPNVAIGQTFSSLWVSYQNRILALVQSGTYPDLATALDTLDNQFQTAECLYLILTTGATDESFGRSQVQENEIADTDRDGMPEFIDAWARPINFIRWAPGFVSPLQPQITIRTTDPRFGSYDVTQPKDALGNVLTRDPVGHHDPFDPRSLDAWVPGNTTSERGFALTPLVFSNGTDGEAGLYYGLDNAAAPNDPPFTDTYYVDAMFGYRGAPAADATTGEAHHLDNIHNHDLGAQ